MLNNPQAALFNSALRNGGDPANILKLLADEYLRLDEAGRANLAMVAFGEIAARILRDRIEKRSTS